jgi:hypothetical protein
MNSEKKMFINYLKSISSNNESQIHITKVFKNDIIKVFNNYLIVLDITDTHVKVCNLKKKFIMMYGGICVYEVDKLFKEKNSEFLINKQLDDFIYHYNCRSLFDIEIN